MGLKIPVLGTWKVNWKGKLINFKKIKKREISRFRAQKMRPLITNGSVQITPIENLGSLTSPEYWDSNYLLVGEN